MITLNRDSCDAGIFEGAQIYQVNGEGIRIDPTVPHIVEGQNCVCHHGNLVYQKNITIRLKTRITSLESVMRHNDGRKQVKLFDEIAVRGRSVRRKIRAFVCLTQICNCLLISTKSHDNNDDSIQFVVPCGYKNCY